MADQEWTPERLRALDVAVALARRGGIIVEEGRGRAEAWLVDQMREKGLKVERMADLRDRLLAEIDRGREVYEGTDLMEHRVLRALRREMGRHQKSIQGLWCSFCNSVDGRWPCPSIKEVADELGIN